MVKKKELNISNCGFDHDYADTLVCSQWQSKSNSALYLIYRWSFETFATVIFSISFYSFSQMKPIEFYFIFLTHWGVLINMILGIYGALLVTYWHCDTEYRENIQKKEIIPTAFKIYWAIHNCALELSLVISIFYWFILYPNSNQPLSTPNVLVHGMNSAIMFLDLLVIAFPMRLYHVIQPIGFGLCYTIFSIIYYLCDGYGLDKSKKYIYPPLNWETPDKALITVLGVLILIIVIHTVLFWIYKLRVFIQRRFFTTELVLAYEDRKDVE
ncbi:protein rolling stone-like [Contarinia nasturtii]|uniref:protein rolling stone-like n=1 Tax=Contarinia nasturtii TaxID=265458 RepID=UPI0012D4A535|nr:protein rolling stone-like [Contarinia nasturtii]